MLALGVLVGVALLLLPALGVSVEQILETRQGQDATELDGRDVIWSLALQEWMRNPLFGTASRCEWTHTACKSA